MLAFARRERRQKGGNVVKRRRFLWPFPFFFPKAGAITRTLMTHTRVFTRKLWKSTMEICGRTGRMSGNENGKGEQKGWRRDSSGILE